MSSQTKSFILYAVVAVLVVLGSLSIIYGSVLPLTKARRYIHASQSVSSVKSFAEFKNLFDSALDFPSPVGQEEVAKFLGNEIFRAVSNPNQPEEVARTLVGYIEPRLIKDDVRHLLLIGRMRYLLWSRYRMEADYAASEGHFSRARELGPDLPNPLYGLFELYQSVGDVEKLRQTGAAILERWPNDGRISAALAAPSAMD